MTTEPDRRAKLVNFILDIYRFKVPSCWMSEFDSLMNRVEDSFGT